MLRRKFLATTTFSLAAPFIPRFGGRGEGQTQEKGESEQFHRDRGGDWGTMVFPRLESRPGRGVETGC